MISQSPTDVGPAFDAIVRAAVRLFRCDLAFFLRCQGATYAQAALAGPDGSSLPLDPTILPIDPEINFPSRTFVSRKNLHLSDWSAIDLPAHERRIHETYSIYSSLFVPLILRAGECFGLLALASKQPRVFDQSEIALAESFRDQAVIAIENARLFNEVRERSNDLSEALQHQTATADVLKVISRSAFDLQSVLDTLVESVTRLCDADQAWLFEREGDVFRWAAGIGLAYAELREFFDTRTISVDRGSVTGRTALEARVINVPDVLADADYTWNGAQEIARFRAALGVPLLRQGKVMGVIFAGRMAPQPFTSRQVELVNTFADQAVIAIENTRLLNELRESLQQQTATAEVLQIISASPGDLAPIFEKMLENATRVCGAEFGSMNLLEGDMLRQAALYNAPAAFAAERLNKAFRIHPRSSLAEAIRGKHVVQVDDIRKHPAYLERNPSSVELTELAGARTIVVVPMLREGEVIGVITVYRQEVRPFDDKQVDLLTNFARQAVIAIENARLLQALRQRTADLSNSLNDLRAAQDRLVQTEKLASLGQLTAGIAHEIKNPLNFVNNFSAISAELVDEMTEVLADAGIEAKKREELDEIRQLLKSNLEKVVQHGKRADSIVKNMLLHSRQGAGERRPVDINAMVDESLNLAYHGARAEKTDFNIALERDFDPGAGMANIYPQEITRVLLNLISNGFYAVTRRASEVGNGFEPKLWAATKDLGETVEIRLRDNGTGILSDVKDKIFNPFFTTKPAGEGTGLGLSISHDIVVKQHGGTIEVETEVGAFTEFRIVLPRTGTLRTKSGEQE